MFNTFKFSLGPLNPVIKNVNWPDCQISKQISPVTD